MKTFSLYLSRRHVCRSINSYLLTSDLKPNSPNNIYSMLNQWLGESLCLWIYLGVGILVLLMLSLRQYTSDLSRGGKVDSNRSGDWDRLPAEKKKKNKWILDFVYVLIFKTLISIFIVLYNVRFRTYVEKQCPWKGTGVEFGAAARDGFEVTFEVLRGS